MIVRRTVEIGFAAVTALFGAVIARGATEFGIGWSSSGPEPGAFPFYIGCIVALASLVNITQAILSQATASPVFLDRAQIGRILHFVLPIIAFVGLTLGLGLYVATALYMFFVMRIQSRYPAWHAVLVALGMPITLYFLLEKGFQVSLLKGPLEAAMGL